MKKQPTTGWVLWLKQSKMQLRACLGGNIQWLNRFNSVLDSIQPDNRKKKIVFELRTIVPEELHRSIRNWFKCPNRSIGGMPCRTEWGDGRKLLIRFKVYVALHSITSKKSKAKWGFLSFCVFGSLIWSWSLIYLVRNRLQWTLSLHPRSPPLHARSSGAARGEQLAEPLAQ